ncbi:uncharacterized protein LOC131665836 [Phymastichus coffea]|uniref:uncharacterized protein LOC131665836 n=1 Tax=Phymastichus coffea TaxID=108790 RepID=UPI00273C07F9|nr:uncharacterized protein LOC131665836 [Phymastichus coffea]
MAEFLSLYRKDYRWPRLKPPFERTDLRCKLAVPMSAEEAAALQLKCGPQRYGDVNEDAPKLGKIGPCPKTERLEYSEEDACLKKLLEDNPNLLSVMRKKPVTDVIMQFNKDRLTSTYQADFDRINVRQESLNPRLEDEPAAAEWSPDLCPLDDAPPAEPECKSKHVSRKQLLRMVYGPGYCAPGPPCTRPYIPKRKKPQFDDACQPQYKRKCIPKWTSEYREIISSTGLDIMRDVRVKAKKKCRAMTKNADRKECEKQYLLTFG